MSSILRALKKLDEDAAAGKGQTGEGSPQIKMRQVIHRRTRASRVFNRFLFISAALLLVGAATFIVVNPKGKPSITKEQDTPPPKHSSPQRPPLIKEESPKRSVPAAIKDESAKPSTGTVSPSSESGSAARVERGETDPGQEPATKNLRPDLVLVGILWSDIPERRVALINDRYLKRGDRIGGVSVVKIERKRVTLQSGGEKWTLTVKD